MAEFACAFVLRLLVSFQVDAALVELQNFGREDVDCLLQQSSFSGVFLDFLSIHNVTLDQVRYRRCVLDVDYIKSC